MTLRLFASNIKAKQQRKRAASVPLEGLATPPKQAKCSEVEEAAPSHGLAEPERELRDMGASFESAPERPLAASAPRTPELPDMGASLESVPTPQGEMFLAPSTPGMPASLQSVPIRGTFSWP